MYVQVFYEETQLLFKYPTYSHRMVLEHVSSLAFFRIDLLWDFSLIWWQIMLVPLLLKKFPLKTPKSYVPEVVQ